MGCEGCAKWPEVLPQVESLTSGGIAVSHTPFDRIAVDRACLQAGRPAPQLIWLDSARVTRRAWPEFSHKGYGLLNITAHLGIPLAHAHDALCDARACGLVLVRAIAEAGITAEGWLARTRKPISLLAGIDCLADPEGHVYGENLLFTGSLSMSRAEAARIGAKEGCTIHTGINKQTSILVVGDQDMSKLAGKEKSSKHLKALSFISQGATIRILRESDFLAAMTILEQPVLATA